MEGPGSGGAEPATRGDTAPLRAPRPGNVNDLGLGSAIMPTIKTDKSGGPLASAAVRPADAAASYGRRGDLEVRLASSPREIDAAQAIRYRVFYEEMSAISDAETRARKRDADRFDEICDHLLVLDHALVPGEDGELPPEDPESLKKVVGCYRLLRQDVAERHGGFYTASEYDIALAGAPCRSQISGAWPFLRAEALPHQADRRTALARHHALCDRAHST